MEPCLKSEDVFGRSFKAFLDSLEQSKAPIHPRILVQQFKNLELGDSELAPWTIFDESAYARNRVAIFPSAEVIVMCWRSGQLTPIHNHKGSACAVRVLKGNATEISYQRSNCGALVPSATTRCVTGDVVGAFDEDIHQLGNLEGPKEDLVTLHCYSPPLTQMELFSEKSAFFDGYADLVTRVTNKLSSTYANSPTA